MNARTHLLTRLLFFTLSLLPAASTVHAGPVPGGGGEPAVVRWNAFARSRVAQHRPSQQAALRLFAYLSWAQHEALSALPPTAGAVAVAGTVAGASAAVLTHLFPADSAAVEAFAAAGDGLSGPDRAAFEAHRARGRAAAGPVVARARTDGFDAPWSGEVPAGPGRWKGATPLLPRLGSMRTFLLPHGAAARPGPPPAPGTPAFDAALDEVRRLAGRRTAAQVQSALFWDMTTGSLVAGFWNALAADLAVTHGRSEGETARLLATMSLAAMDAGIACHDAKYTYWLPRPSQADPSIRLAVGLPNHPSYPSNHACISGAAAYVLGDFFPDERGTLADIAGDASRSRLYAGLHYRFDMDAGLSIARAVADLARSHGLPSPAPVREAAAGGPGTRR